MAREHHGRGGERGGVGAGQLALIGTVALVGLGGLTSLGGGMGTAIDGGQDGQGVSVAVAAAGGEVAPPPVLPPGAGPLVTVTAEPATGEWEGTVIPGADLPPGTLDTSGDRGGEGGGGCGWNPICHAGNAARGLSDLRDSALSAVRDAGEWFVNTPFARAIGGFADGVWDALYGMGKGLLTAVWRVGWDFIVEDLLVGGWKGLYTVASCKAGLNSSDSCDEYGWNPLKDTTDSLGNFVTKIPEARHALGDMLHQGSLCLNPWNGQSSEDRGHACGETFVAIADIVIGAKGAGKAGKLLRGASKGDEVAEVAEVAGRGATKADDVAEVGSDLAARKLDEVNARYAETQPAYRDLPPEYQRWVDVESEYAGLEILQFQPSNQLGWADHWMRRADLVDEAADLHQRGITPTVTPRISTGDIAKSTEAWADNCHLGTCSNAAWRNARDGGALGYESRTHVMRFTDGKGHAVTELVRPDGSSTYLSWGKEYASLEDIGRGFPEFHLELRADGAAAYREATASRGWDDPTRLPIQ